MGRRKLGKNRPPKKMYAFLKAYEETGNMTRASQIADMHDSSHYEWLEKYDWYHELFDEAHMKACRRLEEEARRRAVEGVEEPVFHKGEVCGVITKYSDTLLIFLMKGAMPEKYRERVESRIHADVTQKTRVLIHGRDNGRNPELTKRITNDSNGNGRVK